MIVIYRACSLGSPYKGKIDKPEVVKRCFKSFKKAFKDVDYDLVVLLDKPTPKMRDIFKGENVEETFYAGFDEGNTSSFHRQLDIATSTAHKSFFLCEDDYEFAPSAGQIIKDATQALDFLTPYDHPDYYFRDIHEYKREVVLTAGRHWQSVSATTLTFAGKVETLKKEMDCMKRYGWADYDMWLDVTERYNLWAAIPSLATHMDEEFIAPMWDLLKTS